MRVLSIACPPAGSRPTQPSLYGSCTSASPSSSPSTLACEEPAVGKRINSWLPPDKQFLVTRGVACHRRVRDIEASLAAEAREDAEGWVLPVEAEEPEEVLSVSVSGGETNPLEKPPGGSGSSLRDTSVSAAEGLGLLALRI
ncbi:hypothetical protein ETH_00000235 [Eimeria tenella]|uniref:Uncharacterized protein n=1 Tax=Eimeria tenella TaxID=5802 RepID=U6L0S0_EIMTE|nr:hypothetical protein ETH_00000235 [Eimeria tenella]CDJ43977.1 hypothetical protein ETH_00000235 [Eimeria tenella]|eukprot:XP_013234726.1 hypothetical protein ETH_00000235 [Eimeria tenella]